MFRCSYTYQNLLIVHKVYGSTALENSYHVKPTIDSQNSFAITRRIDPATASVQQNPLPEDTVIAGYTMQGLPFILQVVSHIESNPQQITALRSYIDKDMLSLISEYTENLIDSIGEETKRTLTRILASDIITKKPNKTADFTYSLATTYQQGQSIFTVGFGFGYTGIVLAHANNNMPTQLVYNVNINHTQHHKVPSFISNNLQKRFTKFYTNISHEIFYNINSPFKHTLVTAGEELISYTSLPSEYQITTNVNVNKNITTSQQSVNWQEIYKIFTLDENISTAKLLISATEIWAENKSEELSAYYNKRNQIRVVIKPITEYQFSIRSAKEKLFSTYVLVIRETETRITSAKDRKLNTTIQTSIENFFYYDENGQQYSINKDESGQYSDFLATLSTIICRQLDFYIETRINIYALSENQLHHIKGIIVSLSNNPWQPRAPHSNYIANQTIVSMKIPDPELQLKIALITCYMQKQPSSFILNDLQNATQVLTVTLQAAQDYLRWMEENAISLQGDNPSATNIKRRTHLWFHGKKGYGRITQIKTLCLKSKPDCANLARQIQDAANSSGRHEHSFRKFFEAALNNEKLKNKNPSQSSTSLCSIM